MTADPTSSPGETIELSEYSLPQGELLRVMARRHAKIPLAATTILLIALTIPAFVADWRFAMLALMLVLVVGPMLMAWLYVRHCLTRDVAMNVARHTASVSSEGICVNWRPAPMRGERDAAEAADPDENDERVAVELPLRTDTIPISRVTGITFALHSMTVWLADTGHGPGIFHIPYDTIPPGKADILVEILQNNRKKV